MNSIGLRKLHWSCQLKTHQPYKTNKENITHLRIHLLQKKMERDLLQTILLYIKIDRIVHCVVNQWVSLWTSECIQRFSETTMNQFHSDVPADETCCVILTNILQYYDT